MLAYNSTNEEERVPCTKKLANYQPNSTYNKTIEIRAQENVMKYIH